MEKLSIRPRDVVKHEFVEGWIAKAEEDLGVARMLLVQGPRYLGPIAFHAQQAAEKYVKAFLTHHQIEFPKTHELNELLDLMAQVDVELSDLLRPSDSLSKFAVETRYSSGPEPETIGEARHAIALAERVRDEVRKALGGVL